MCRPYIADIIAAMMPPRLIVPRADVDLADPWNIPPGVGTFDLVRTTDGQPPALPTKLAIYRSGAIFHALFLCDDDYVMATMMERDASLYEEDAVEVFLAPSRLDLYYEFEANPLGSLFDARIHSPEGDRRTMNVDRSWDAAGLLAKVRRRVVDGEPTKLDVLISFPLTDIDPEFAGGVEWQANFYRIDRRPKRRAEFTAWSPTLVEPADFHVPGRFGTLVFD